MVVYELNVREFNRDFPGVVTQLDYIWELGVNVLELMPITNVREDVEWGYTPLSYFAPDERLGGVLGLKQLIDACHQRGVAVVLDAVYAHAHPEYAYNLVYETTGEPNPMMGQFAGEFFSRPGMDYRKQFTSDYFYEVNKYWLEEYHVDGFRYDYVPGMYDGPVGPGYADLVYRTYQYSKGVTRFQVPGRSKIIQCAEHLPDPIGILSKTYSNCCWQNGLLDRARDMARWNYADERIAHVLDPQFLGYPAEYNNPAAGDSFPVAPFQYLESHDHRRFINEFGVLGQQDLLGEAYGDRNRFYREQPFIIGLYTGKGIPMLWQGQEFGENWGVPGWGVGRNLFERPLHWEYFYDQPGKALVRLHRILGALRRSRRALNARGFFYYFNLQEHLDQGVVAYRREADPAPGQAAERLVVALNFSDRDADVWIPFPFAGQWDEQIDGSVVGSRGRGWAASTGHDSVALRCGVPVGVGRGTGRGLTAVGGAGGVDAADAGVDEWCAVFVDPPGWSPFGESVGVDGAVPAFGEEVVVVVAQSRVRLSRSVVPPSIQGMMWWRSDHSGWRCRSRGRSSRRRGRSGRWFGCGWRSGGCGPAAAPHRRR